jgi:DNA-binding transcriptional regulator LsrR (DeoR family)
MDYKRVLRLHYVNGFSSRVIAESTGDGKSTINEFLKRFRENEVLSWPLSDDITNEMIGEMLYQKPGNAANDNLYRSFDEEVVHRKLAKKGETLLHLWM